MIYGAHFLLYSKDPEADRVFFRDVLKFRNIDIGDGWLIFSLPPTEMAVHPGDFAQHHSNRTVSGCLLYLMCSDLTSAVKKLAAAKVQCTEIEDADWGIKTTVRLPSGGEIGLYQPKHLTAI